MAESAAIAMVGEEHSVLPEGWVQARMGCAGTWHTGGTPSRKMKEYFGGAIPWVKSGDLNDGSVQKTEETISAGGLASSAAKLPREAPDYRIGSRSLGFRGIASCEL